MGVRPFSEADLTARLNGRAFLRAVIVATAGTPKDNLNTTAAGAVLASLQYTLLGGEVLLLQGDGDFYYELSNNLTTAMTASGGKAPQVLGGAPGERLILFGDDKRVMIDAVSGTVTVKVFELR